jgi:DNA-binding IclR family transcriptional regulator
LSRGAEHAFSAGQIVGIVLTATRLQYRVLFIMRTTNLDTSNPQAAARDTSRVQSVDRAVMLLKAISASSRPPTAWELAQTCGINRSTAWRLLQTLEHHGLVERDETTQRYGIGYTALQVASAAGYDSLARRSRPILQRLAEATGESVMLAAVRTFSLVYVDQVDPPGVPIPNWLGRQLPMHATSAGKVFLAWLPDEERDALLPSTLARYSVHTITDRATLWASLADVRRDGYGACVGEFEEFSNGVSAAVLDHRARPAVILNIWGPSQRVSPARLPMLGRMALAAAHEISVVID